MHRLNICMTLLLILLLLILAKSPRDNSDESMCGGCNIEGMSERPGAPSPSGWSYGRAATNDKMVVYLHYTNWCGACKQMKPVWNRVRGNLEGDIVFVEVDEEVAKSKFIDRYPTIIKTDRNGKSQMYRGGPNEAQIIAFIQQP